MAALKNPLQALRENAGWIAIGAFFIGGFFVREYQDHKDFEQQQESALRVEVRRRLEESESPEEIEIALAGNKRLVKESS